VDAALLKADGLPVHEEERLIQLKPCPVCSFPNQMGAYHCARPGCNSLLVIRSIDDVVKNKTLMRQILTKAIANEGYMEELTKDFKLNP
jgi:hypothetical protein